MREGGRTASDRPGRSSSPRVAILAAALLVGLAGAAPATTRAAADPSGAELMRLTNLDRVALGLRPLSTDSVLVSIARDRVFRCPSRASHVFRWTVLDAAGNSRSTTWTSVVS